MRAMTTIARIIVVPFPITLLAENRPALLPLLLLPLLLHHLLILEVTLATPEDGDSLRLRFDRGRKY